MFPPGFNIIFYPPGSFLLFSLFCLFLISSISATKEAVPSNNLVSSVLELVFTFAVTLFTSSTSRLVLFLSTLCDHVLLFQKFPLMFLTQIFPPHSLVFHRLLLLQYLFNIYNSFSNTRCFILYRNLFLCPHLMLRNSVVYLIMLNFNIWCVTNSGCWTL